MAGEYRPFPRIDFQGQYLLIENISQAQKKRSTVMDSLEVQSRDGELWRCGTCVKARKTGLSNNCVASMLT